ncbi:hypothetical protein CCMA1212_004574 [Trichoderma ghanense]|uniref:Uncharacterized protein n=1 Tax=Trichoderma ghanense TaxID=65468 RepID=A0ABY2H5X2_9HYPO
MHSYDIATMDGRDLDILTEHKGKRQRAVRRRQDGILFQNSPDSCWQHYEQLPPCPTGTPCCAQKHRRLSPGSAPGNTRAAQGWIELSLLMPGLLGTKCRNRGTLVQPVDDKLVGVLLVLSGACRLRKISLPAPPCGKKESPHGEQLDRHVFYGNGKRTDAQEQDLSHQLRFECRRTSSLARITMAAQEQATGGLLDGVVARRPLNPSMLIPILFMIAG